MNELKGKDLEFLGSCTEENGTLSIFAKEKESGAVYILANCTPIACASDSECPKDAMVDFSCDFNPEAITKMTESSPLRDALEKWRHSVENYDQMKPEDLDRQFPFRIPGTIYGE